MSLEEDLGIALRKRGATIALAESCTGGLIASRITDVPGASDYFLASYITYSNASKVRTLGVREGTLTRHGAVSAEAAREMAAGARRISGADAALAVTGIAGPGGGTPTKPVGLVFFALDDGEHITVDHRTFPGSRLDVKRAASDQALLMLLKHFTP